MSRINARSPQVGGRSESPGRSLSVAYSFGTESSAFAASNQQNASPQGTQDPFDVNYDFHGGLGAQYAGASLQFQPELPSSRRPQSEPSGNATQEPLPRFGCYKSPYCSKQDLKASSTGSSGVRTADHDSRTNTAGLPFGGPYPPRPGNDPAIAGHDFMQDPRSIPHDTLRRIQNDSERRHTQNTQQSGSFAYGSYPTPTQFQHLVRSQNNGHQFVGAVDYHAQCQRSGAQCASQGSSNTTGAHTSEQLSDDQNDGPALHYQTLKAAVFQTRVAYFTPNLNDLTIPSTEATKRHIVRRLVAAIWSIDHTAEVHTSTRFEARWVKKTYYKEEQIERLSWTILGATISLHRNGWSFPVFDEHHLATIASTRGWTFSDRMEKIEALLKWSKTICMDLLKGEKILTVVRAPHLLIERSKMNKKQNEARKTLIQLGRQGKGRMHQVPVNSHDDKQEEAGSFHTAEDNFAVKPSIDATASSLTAGSESTSVRSAKGSPTPRTTAHETTGSSDNDETPLPADVVASSCGRKRRRADQEDENSVQDGPGLGSARKKARVMNCPP